MVQPRLQRALSLHANGTATQSRSRERLKLSFKGRWSLVEEEQGEEKEQSKETCFLRATDFVRKARNYALESRVSVL